MSPPNADQAADDGPQFDPARIVDTLARHGVDYVMVGGMAAQLHGATRTTMDLDCLPRLDGENLQRLAVAMRELRARLRAEGLSDEESLQLTRHLPSPEFFGQGGISNWMTDAGPLDVMPDMPDRAGHRLVYDQLVERSIAAVHAGVTVRIAGLDDIVASKEYANRDKDQQALPELHAIQQRSTERGPDDRTLTNDLDLPGGAQRRPPER